MNPIRNIAIIAHVDHGKTTLVDALLRQSQTKLSKDVVDSTLIMDSNELERERGITIFSKNASIVVNGVKINIIDTPGHADFGGEVERVLTMADGCLLLIDAHDGPMPQTRFVLKQALGLKHKIIVVINKIDRPDLKIQEVLNKIYDLFIDLGATDETINYPVIYASGKLGLAGRSPTLTSMKDIQPLFDTILNQIPAPHGDPNKPLQILVTNITADNYKGRIAIGKIYNGQITLGQNIAHINRSGEIKTYRLTYLATFEGLERVAVNTASTGDIIAVAGIPDITIGETLADKDNPQSLPLLSIEEPTIKIRIGVNSAPFAGLEGEFKTSSQIRARLYKELEHDVALQIEEGDDNTWIVSGRGELHLAIFIERMRREGYEFEVGRPQVITKVKNGKTLAPYEYVTIEVPKNHQGIVMQKMGERRGELKELTVTHTIATMEFVIPTRNLLGYRSEFITDTQGLGVINHAFYGYFDDTLEALERKQGSLVAFETGTTSLYGLVNIQDRGSLFIGAGIKVYKGEIVGQNARGDDMRVNVCKTKKLTNMRSKGEGVSVHFDTPKTMDLEDALEYIADDELVEVTPKSIRLRKVILDQLEERRKRILGIS